MHNAQIHILDGQHDMILDFITAKDIIDDTHKKSLEDTLETYDFITFADKRFSQHLEKRNRIIIPDEDETLREFVIFEAAKYRDTEGYKAQVFSHASYLELNKAKILYPTRREELTASQHAGWALNDTGWQVGIVEVEGTRTFTIENHTNPYEFLKRISREFEVELRFRVEHDGQRITGRYVDLLERVGEWRGREIEFGKDLDGIRRVEKQDIVTALLGLGPEREDGSRIEVLVEDEEALQRWGRVDEHGNLHHLIEPYEIQSDRQEMTEEEARRYTRTALDKRINTQVTYETTVLDLEEVPGLENKQIRFGDTIRIKDTHFNPPLYLEARVFEIERSIKSKAKKDIKLGDYIEYTEDEVHETWRQYVDEIRKRLERLVLVSIISSAGNVFKNGEGSTELTAKTFLGGAEVDEDGTKYEYRWHKFDKNGDYDAGFYEEGKTITINASDIDEKASFRVEIILDDEVLTVDEITLTNVFDGEDGEPGPPGPKGEDGQSVEDITIEYYLSTSGSTQTGGTWTETKPTYQPGKYLWIRQKITYKNPTAIEYTTPVLDDSWKAVEIADEAKQEAEEAKQEAQNAMSTADGKNTVFRQSNTPPTTNRKIGDLWFKTDEGNKMFVWTGSWTETKLDHQALSVGKLSAISANLGDITAGTITGVNIYGSRIEGTVVASEYTESNNNYSAQFDKGELFLSRQYGDNPIQRVSVRGDRIYLSGSSGSAVAPPDYQINNSTSIGTYSMSGDGTFPNSAFWMSFGKVGIGGAAVGNDALLGELEVNKVTLAYSTSSNMKAEVYATGTTVTANLMNNATIKVERDIEISGRDIILKPRQNPTFPDYGSVIVDGILETEDDINAQSNIVLSNASGANNNIELNGGHMISSRSGNMTLYPNRGSGIFEIRSHSNKRGYSSDFWIAEDGTIFSNPTYNNTSSNQPNVRIASAGGNYRFYRTTSSEKYKADVKSSDVNPYKLLDLEIKSWVDKKEYEDNDNSSEGLRRIHGLIAEDLEKVGLHQFVDYINGEVENYDQRVFALLIPIVRDLLNEVKGLKQELETLKGAN